MAKTYLKNCNYNLANQLVKKLKFLWVADGLIADAKRDGHKDCEKMWHIIKKDEEKHAEMLRKQLIKKIKKDEFS